ncbi:tRNA(adenine34) deaminase [Lunasporangiospora selenospora]|uniref:tRNA(Adenine34) deaminase n=1 Tax=Lunasporangiospora selenospora TaxID=979761 RepID=A0A9P6FVV9_9FUNG|nr:tRNA(adenine34) deaminase [Lunasporangiospora selenospora]
MVVPVTNGHRGKRSGITFCKGQRAPARIVSMESGAKAESMDTDDIIVQEDAVHYGHMRAALDLALEAHSVGEVPVGCVFVHEPSGEIIGRGRNRTNESLNGTRHAEFEAIDMILSQEGYRIQAENPEAHFWKDVALYVTIEPCVMCASALRQLGIGSVYFGAGNDRFGGNGSVFNIHTE